MSPPLPPESRAARVRRRGAITPAPARYSPEIDGIGEFSCPPCSRASGLRPLVRRLARLPALELRLDDVLRVLRRLDPGVQQAEPLVVAAGEQGRSRERRRDPAAPPEQHAAEHAGCRERA